MPVDRSNLPPYAEPVSADRLQENEIYFSVNYLDDEMLLPIVEPVVFVGWNLESDDDGRVYFQDADSFRRGIRFEDSSSESAEATFFVGSKNELSHIFTYDRALDELVRCATRREAAR